MEEVGAEPRADIIKRLKRIEGQAKGIRNMVESGRSCEEIVIQLAAMKAATVQVAMMMMASHLCNCVTDAMDQGEDTQAVFEKFIKVFNKMA